MMRLKIFRRILVILLVIVVFWSWSEIATPSTYRYPHSVADAVCVELLRNHNTDAFASDDRKFELLKVLEGEGMTTFLSAVRNLETSYCITPPPRGYGEYVARVTYANGDVEYYGTWHIEFVKSGEARTGVGSYSFRDNALESLILEYCGLTPEKK